MCDKINEFAAKEKKNERSHSTHTHSLCIRDIEKFQRCGANATSAMRIGFRHEWKLLCRFQFSFENTDAQLFHFPDNLLSCAMCVPPESYVSHLWIWMSDRNLSRTYLNNGNDQMHKILELERHGSGKRIKIKRRNWFGDNFFSLFYPRKVKLRCLNRFEMRQQPQRIVNGSLKRSDGIHTWHFHEKIFRQLVNMMLQDGFGSYSSITRGALCN